MCEQGKVRGNSGGSSWRYSRLSVSVSVCVCFAYFLLNLFSFCGCVVGGRVVVVVRITDDTACHSRQLIWVCGVVSVSVCLCVCVSVCGVEFVGVSCVSVGLLVFAP